MRKKPLLLMLIFMTGINPAVIVGGNMQHFYDFTVKDIMGLDVKLDTYRGNVILVVNVASKCGFTPQYAGLQKLYETYRDKGLVVLGFPANNFLRQEPGTNQEIKQFCTVNYGVTFPMFAKISVRGKDIHPLFDFLTSGESNAGCSGRITWNFNKFLLNRRGECLRHYPSKVEPGSPELIADIEKALSEN